jgi:hypothetical protein
MKKIIFAFLIAYSIPAGYAQDSLLNASGGTWVVESNISSPKDQVIKFYNSKLELIYEERVSNRKIRYEKERIKKALNKTLEIALRNDKKLEPGTFVSVLRTKEH